MMCCTYATCLGLLTALLYAEDRADVTLVADAKPRAVIVLAEMPTRSAQLAAAELREHVKLMTAAELPIVSETEFRAADGLPIYVGECGATRMVGLASADFAPQENLVRVTADAVFLIGRDERDFGPIDYEKSGTWHGFSFYSRVGTVYAVYEFLERDCGVRWYMVTDLGRVIPKRRTLGVAVQESRRRPWCLHRYIGHPTRPDLMDIGKFGIKGVRRFKKHAPRRERYLYLLRTRWGGETYAANHSVYQYYKRFAKQHPDWWVDGVPGRTKQLRYNHPEVIAQVVADAEEFFAKPFSVRQKEKLNIPATGDYFSVMPLDNRDYGTECEPPLSPERVGEGFGSGVASNYIFTWVNRVAEKVNETYPDVWISTCAYAGMFMPPEFSMHPKVAVTVCMAGKWDEDGFAMKMLREWRRKVSRLSTWEYSHGTMAYARFPPLIPRKFANYAERLQTMGTWAMFMGLTNKIPAIVHTDYTVILKHLTDPDADVEAILDEYYRLFYGPAEKPMRELWTSLQDASAEVHGKPISRTRSWVLAATDERLAAWERLLDDAAAKAQSEPYAARVALIRDAAFRMIREEAELQKKIDASPLPHLTIHKTDNPPALDGKLDDAVWQTAAKTKLFTGLRDEKLETENYARVAYDDKSLYIAMFMQEPRMDEQQLVQMTPGGGICTDDSMEINVDPVPDDADYAQFMMSAKSVQVQWLRPKSRMTRTPPDLGIRGKAWRGKAEWTAEVVIPYEKLGGRPPRPGDEWALNLLRNRCLPDIGWTKPDHFAVWAVPFTGSFHVKERFGTIRFAE